MSRSRFRRASLLKSDLPEGTRIVLVDDQSTNEEVLRMLRELPQKDPRVQVWRNHERMGPNTGQAYNFAKLVETHPCMSRAASGA